MPDDLCRCGAPLSVSFPGTPTIAYFCRPCGFSTQQCSCQTTPGEGFAHDMGPTDGLRRWRAWVDTWS